jgi:hypothetical protein
MEAFLLRLVPELAQGWEGVGREEIDRIEEVARRALPPFYRWFLGRFGGTMGPLRYRSLDFSCKGILAAYAKARVEPDPRYLLIAYDHDPVYSNHAFYDLDRPARDDALIVDGEYLDEEELVPSFETLREMIAWGALFTHGVRKHPQRCAGMLESSSEDARLQLGAVLEALGFENPIATGRYCGVFRGPGMDMVSRSRPGDSPHLQAFDLGAADATTIRRLLGEITSTTSLELRITEWDPVLP